MVFAVCTAELKRTMVSFKNIYLLVELLLLQLREMFEILSWVTVSAPPRPRLHLNNLSNKTTTDKLAFSQISVDHSLSVKAEFINSDGVFRLD